MDLFILTSFFSYLKECSWYKKIGKCFLYDSIYFLNLLSLMFEFTINFNQSILSFLNFIKNLR
ncbi:hypothetical protein LEP1GSC088_3973 [Leptospira interrogans str. L1207]|nr:hypothetical protein LEP1GSC088_3973 [Leptospira interrogans str. L1207]